jgi:hypothetical protein
VRNPGQPLLGVRSRERAERLEHRRPIALELESSQGDRLHLCRLGSTCRRQGPQRTPASLAVLPDHEAPIIVEVQRLELARDAFGEPLGPALHTLIGNEVRELVTHDRKV